VLATLGHQCIQRSGPEIDRECAFVAEFAPEVLLRREPEAVWWREPTSVESVIWHGDTNKERIIEKSSKKDLTNSAPIATIERGGVYLGVCFRE
jgi:hypothetical protein